MAFTEDFSPFFVDFGVDVTLDGGAIVEGLFDKAYIEAMGGAIGSTQPIVVMRASDVATHAIAPGFALSVDGVAYTVRDAQPDGTGLTTLLLEKA